MSVNVGDQTATRRPVKTGDRSSIQSSPRNVENDKAVNLRDPKVSGTTSSTSKLYAAGHIW